MHQLPALLTIEETAPHLRIGRTTAYELVRRGEFPCPVVRCGRKLFVPKQGLLRLLAAEEV